MNLKSLSVLIKPSSSKCNMRCKYCFYFDEISKRAVKDYGYMNNQTSEAIINYCYGATKEDATISFAFQGGEPTLIGIEYFQYFIEYAKKYKVQRKLNFSIQTNGTTLDLKWYQLFKENNFLVGISIDGFSKNHNNARIMSNEDDSYNLILNSLKQLQKHNISFNVLTVVTNLLSKQPKKYFQWILNNKIEHVQIIPCLPTSLCKKDVYKVSPQNLGKFWIDLFDLWYEQLMIYNNYIHIGWFENILLILNGQYPTQCGMLGNCAIQNVIESNGNIYPCDFYCDDKHLLGNVYKNDLKNICQNKVLGSFLKKEELPNICMECPYLKMCGGNCKHMRSNYIDGNYCAYQKLLNEKGFLFKKALYTIKERKMK